MTSAPRSPSNAPHQGPAITRERSTTRMPSRASGKGVMAATIYLQVSTRLYQLGRAGLLGEPEQREGERDDHGSHHHPDRAERSEPSDQSEKDRQRRDLGTAGDEQRANDVVHHRDHDAAPEHDEDRRAPAAVEREDGRTGRPDQRRADERHERGGDG